MIATSDFESKRIEELYSYQILDTPPDRNFDRLTKLAAAVCSTPIAIVSLVDEDRQWFKSSVGLEISQTPRCQAFCAHTIMGTELYQVEDASSDPVFADNPLVTGSFGLRFYAGIPLITPRGFGLGSLCVIDKTPRVLNAQQIDALKTIADEVMVHLELHRQRRLNEIYQARQQKSALKVALLSRALEMRNACSATLIRATDENQLLQDICKLAVEVGGYRMAWIGYAQHDRPRSVLPVAHYGQPDDSGFLDRITISWSADSVYGRGPGGNAIRNAKPVVIENVLTYRAYQPWANAAAKQGFKGAVFIPLKNDDRAFGFLALYSSEVRPVVRKELELLQKLADDIVYGITSLRNEAERNRIEKAILKMAESITAPTEMEFFEHLAINMVEALGADGGFICRLDADHKTASTLAAIVEGRAMPKARFSIAGTACEGLLQQHEVHILSNLPQLFPHSEAADWGMQAYLGRRLGGMDAELIGIICVLFKQPLQQPGFASTALRIFANRASAEIKRIDADRQIQHQASLLDKAHDAILVRDLSGNIIYWNESAANLYGWSAADMLGHSVAMLLPDDHTEHMEAEKLLLRDKEWSGELTAKHKSGHVFMIESHCTLVEDDSGNPISILAIQNDISERKQIEHQIHQLAFYDPLTSLPNRSLLTERLQQALVINHRHQYHSALLFIDLDNFKLLNDSLGHDIGDLLLQKVALRLTACVRASDTVARLGGDEFVVLLTQLNPVFEQACEQAQVLGNKILATCNTPYELGGYEHHSSPSIGVTFLKPEDTVEEVLKRADLAMYQAKAQGRNTLCFFDPRLQEIVSRHARIEAEIRNGIKLKQFDFYYQPQMEAGGRIIGAEALARWQHPKHGLVQPSDFIPLAEISGLILPLGGRLLDIACRQIAQWGAQPEMADMVLAINISSKQLQHEEFVQQVKDALQRHRANPERLKLEITESFLVTNIEDTIKKMHALRRIGVKFSLDDFGTGYSSLTYLKRLPLDQLKIDQSFIREVARDADDAAIARTIVALGENLGLGVMAEGVETDEQRAFLEQNNCLQYQGFLFSQPLSIRQFEDFVRENRP